MCAAKLVTNIGHLRGNKQAGFPQAVKYCLGYWCWGLLRVCKRMPVNLELIFMKERMKKIFIVMSVLLSATVSLLAQNEAAMKIEIENGTLKVAGRFVTPHWKTRVVTGSLTGTPRVELKSNKLYTFDRYGLVVFEKPVNGEGSGDITELQVFFSTPGAGDTDGIKPADPFPGTFTIEGLTINAGTDLATLKTKLAGYAAGEGYKAHMYKFSKNNLYLYFLFDETDKKLIRLSIGKDD